MAIHKLKYNGTEIDGILDNAYSLRGIIVMWSGAINAIPEGWVLCDGTNGTPDLRNRFVVGAGIDYSVGNTGGSKTVTLTTDQMPSHTHTINESGEHRHAIDPSWVDASTGYYSDVGEESRSATAYTEYAGAHTHTMSSVGSGSAHENRPPYYALAYIMKL